MLTKQPFFLLTVTVLFTGTAVAANLHTLHEWKYVDYVWDTLQQKQRAIDSAEYDAAAVVLYDVDQASDGRIFVTAVRNEGVPASLMTVSDRMGLGGPLLRPYPDWSWTTTDDCTGIVGVYRVAIDDCNRLWILDTGKIGDTFLCPARLLVFDLKSDKLIRRVTIPDPVARNQTTGLGLLATPLVKTHGDHCEDVTVYMADVEGYGLVVWNGKDAWRLQSNHFGPVQAASNYTVAGESFYVEDGILGMGLIDFPRETVLYFRPMSSYNMYSVTTDDIDKSRFRTDDITYRNNGRLLSQSAVLAVSRSSILFFGIFEETAIGCWHPRSIDEYVRTTVVARDERTLQFPSGMKILNGYEETLLVLTNRYQKVAAGTKNIDEINFRILAANVSTLVRGTDCALAT